MRRFDKNAGVLVLLSAVFSAVLVVQTIAAAGEQSGNPGRETAERAAATSGCGCGRSARQVQPVQEMLSDPSWTVRKAATEALGNSPDHRSEVIPQLMKMLEDPEPQVVRAAIISLGRVGRGYASAQEAVARFADDPDPRTNESAVVALANLSGIQDNTIPVIMGALGSKEESLVKLAAATVSGADEAVIPKLVPALMQNLESGQQPAVTNTLALLRYMTRYSDQLIGALTGVYDNAKPETRPHILRTLAVLDKTGNRSIQFFLKAFKDPSPATRKQAIVGIARTNPGADTLWPIVESALKDPDLDVRLQALATIRVQGDRLPDAFPRVIAATGDNDPKIRIAALATLVGFKKAPQDPAQILKQSAKDDKDPEVRTAAFAILAGMGSAQAQTVIPFLEKAMETEESSKMKSFLSSAINGLRRRMALEKDGIVPGEQLGR